MSGRTNAELGMPQAALKQSGGGKGGNPTYPSTTGKPSGDKRGNTPKGK